MLLHGVRVRHRVMLAVTGPSDYGGPTGWLQLHRLSFIAWLFFMAVHVLAYVGAFRDARRRGARRLPARRAGRAGGRAGRRVQGGTLGGPRRFSAAVAPGSPCWSPPSWPAW